MAVYSVVTAGEKDPESPIDVSLIGKLDQNPEAMIEGASGAPRIQTAALEQTGGSEAVTQACIRDSAVGQGQLKTTTGSVSQGGAPGNVTLPGGTYGFYPQTRVNNASYGGITVDITYSDTSISYLTRIGFTNITVGEIGYAQQRYVQSSPPYDLGDGEVPLFIFAEIDKAAGNVVGAYEAPEAPWHNNGPTNTRADTYIDGVGYQYRKDAHAIDDAMFAAGHPRGLTRATSKALSINAYIDYLAAFEAAPSILLEVTQDIKQTDMNLPGLSLPMEPRDGVTKIEDINGDLITPRETVVVMLDPVADLTARLFELKKHDEFSINELLHDGDLIITDKVNRAAPNGVPVHGYKWR